MSDEETQVINDLHEAAEKWGLVLKAVRVLVIGAFVLGSWVATLEWRQRALDAQTTQGSEVLNALNHWKTKVEGTRWTIQQHQEWAAGEMKREALLMDRLQEQNTLQELRLQRLEDGMSNLKSELDEKLRITPSDVLEEVRKLGKQMGN